MLAEPGAIPLGSRVSFVSIHDSEPFWKDLPAVMVKAIKCVQAHDYEEFAALTKQLQAYFEYQFSYLPDNLTESQQNAKKFTTFNGFTLLHTAALHSAAGISEILIEESPNLVNIASKSGCLPLHIACLVDDFISVRIISAVTYDLNQSDKNGNTSLHYAGLAGQKSLLSLLKHDSIDYTVTNKNEKSAITFATEHHEEENANLIERIQQPHGKSHLWNALNLSQYQCFKRKADKKDSCRCSCGLELEEHQPLVNKYNNPIQPLKSQSDHLLVSAPCTTFGEMKFSGLNQTAKYLRISDNSALEDVCKGMKKQIHSKPTLLISVHGDKIERNIVKEIFKKALWKAASSPGSWILSNGENSNLNQVIGLATKDYCDAYGKDLIQSVGIASWNRLKEKSYLDSHSYKGLFPANYQPDSEIEADQIQLEPNQSYFLLVDTGINSKVGCEVDFRCQLQKEMVSWPNEKELHPTPCPICGILVGGNRNTLLEIHSAVTFNRYTCVVLKGTGGLADMIGSIFDQLNENERKLKKNPNAVVQEVDDTKLLNMLQEVFLITYNEDLSKELNYLKTIIKNRHLLEIFSIDEDKASDLDAMILSALLTSTSALNANQDPSRLDIGQLQMSIALDRSDVASEKIFTDGKTWKKGELDETMIKVLLDSKVAFVKLFIQKGFAFEDFVTIDILERLYNDDIQKRMNSILIALLEENKITIKKSTLISLTDVGNVIKSIVNSAYSPNYLKDEFLMMSQSKLGHFRLERPVHEILLWCVLTERPKLAELFWTLDKEPIANALLAAMLFRQIVRKTDDINFQDEYDEWAEKFESQAEGVLDECYADNPEKAHAVVVRVLEHHGGSTCFVLAAEGDSIKFIAHRCCQELLELIWRDNLDDKNSLFQVSIGMIFGITCPLFIPVFVKYKPVYMWPEDKMLEGRKSKVEPMLEIRRMSMAPSSFTTKKKETKQYRLISIYFKMIADFYMSPVVRFTYSTISYMIFLALFAFYLLFDINENTSLQDPLPYILLLWVFSLALEEAQQIYDDGTSFDEYISDVWNKMDVMAIFCFSIGFLLLLLSHSDSIFNLLYYELIEMFVFEDLHEVLIRLTRFLAGFSFIMFFLRLLQVFSIHLQMGPMVVMISNMIKEDLIPFMVIFLTFVLGYGIFMWSIAFPSKSLPLGASLEMIMKMLRVAYFQVQGDYNFNLLLGVGCTDNCPDPWGVWISPILLGIYVVMTNVLLLNLLIAKFSNTYERIHSTSKQHWTLQRYNIMNEYTNRSPLPPPLTILWFILKTLIGVCNLKWRYSGTYSFRKSFTANPQEEHRLVQWEMMRAQAYMRLFDDVTGKQKREGSRGGGSSMHQTVNIKKDLALMKQELTDHFKEDLKEIENRVIRLEPMEGRINDIYDLFKDFIVRLNEQGYQMKSPVNEEAIVVESVNLVQGMRRLASTRDRSTISSNLSEEDIEIEDMDNLGCPEIKLIWFKRIKNHTIVRINLISGATPMEDFPSRNQLYADCYWIDPETTDGLTFNSFDSKTGLLRSSIVESYQISNDNVPETVSTDKSDQFGQHLMPFWGPNHAIHLIFTRWKRDGKDNIIKRNGQRVLQVVLNTAARKIYKLPWFLIAHHSPSCEPVYCALEAFLNFFDGRTRDIKKEKQPFPTIYYEEVKGLLLAIEPEIIYRGYAKEKSDTDNAWLETVVYHYHELYNNRFNDTFLQLMKINATFDKMEWIDLVDRKNMEPNHRHYLKLVAEKQNASF